MTDTPQAPFAFMPAKAKGTEAEPAKRTKRKRSKKAKAEIAQPMMARQFAVETVAPRKRRTRRTHLNVLKACVKQLRKAEDAERVIATLRIMFE